MGIPMNHHAFIYGDNKSVLHNTTKPDSTIKNKAHSIDFHFVREGCASDFNPSDMCTKPIPAGPDRYRKVRSVLYDIYPENDDAKFY